MPVYIGYFSVAFGFVAMAVAQGVGERGRNLDHIYRLGIPKLIKKGTGLPAVVLFPQCPAQFIWNNMVKELKSLMVNVIAERNILNGYGHNDGIDYAYRETDLIARLLTYRKSDHTHIPEPCEELF